MLKRCLPLALLIAFPVTAFSQQQDDAALRARALDFAISQRNAAMDSILMCQADGSRQLEAAKKEIAELKKQLADKTTPESK